MGTTHGWLHSQIARPNLIMASSQAPYFGDASHLGAIPYTTSIKSIRILYRRFEGRDRNVQFLKTCVYLNRWVTIEQLQQLWVCVWPWTGNLGWGSWVESSIQRKTAGSLKIAWPSRALEEPWNSLINRVKSYLLTALCFWLAR
jgi:hypothetical protein